jgi:hypothetical protein
MNFWKPDASQIVKIQRLAKELPSFRPTIVGFKCDVTVLQAIANNTTKDLLLADELPCLPEMLGSKAINHISGEWAKIVSMLTKVKFQADLFVIASLSELPTALSFCTKNGEGILFVETKALKELAYPLEGPYAEIAEHIWGQIGKGGINGTDNEMVALFFASDHSGTYWKILSFKTNGDFDSSYFASGRIGRQVQSYNAEKGTVAIWNKVRKRIHGELLFEFQDESKSPEYSITLGPGMVKFFGIENFLEATENEVISTLKLIPNKFTLNIPTRIFRPKDFPHNGVFMANFLDCYVDISDVDDFLVADDWELRLRTHHAFCHFCFSNAMPSFVYASFHEWLDLKELAFDECLKAWVRDGDQPETILDSYRNSTGHEVLRHANRNWLVYAKTPFVRKKLEAKEADAVNKITVAEIDRIRKSKFSCYVYLMEDLRNNSFKIGKSRTPGKRERTLQSEVPQIVMRFSIPAEEMHEKELHENFEGKRIRGEWFALRNEDLVWLVAYLKKHGDVSRASVDFNWLGSIHFSVPTAAPSIFAP